ncbi:MAG TPA: xanthine dehydrogenase family protein molybdopterin-binding subunit [Myxococcota bacterium]|jgi:CO/xanthine dehydrogenase Mo-binding subunit
MTSTTPTVTTRRGFMKVLGVAGGGLSVGFLLDGCAHVSGGQALGGAFHPNAWVTVGSDDKVIFFLDRAEMGQGILTSHVQMLCEEIEVAPDKVKVEFAPADYDAYGVQLTGGSTSTTSQYDVIRQAGATARELLKKAAARKWQVPPSEIVAVDGTLKHTKLGVLRYGDVAAAAANESVGDVPLKDPSAWKVIGQSLRRLDAAAKVDGSAVFGIDVNVPGMLTAVVIRPPVLRGKVARFDGTKAADAPGVLHVIQIPQGIAVVAHGYWAARKAAELVDVEWDHGAMESFTTAGLRSTHLELLKASNSDVKVATEKGDVDAGMKGAVKRVRSVYEVPFLAHATMEPMNATAYVEHDRARIWAPTQAPTIAKEVVARLTGLPHDKIDVVTTFMGGGFGRRALADFVAEAVEISKRVKAPVKVIWSREDDMHHGLYRPAAVSVIEGGIDASGNPVAWYHRMASQSLFAAFADMLGAMAPEMVPRPITDLLGAGVGKLFVEGHVVDPTAVEGASDQPYAVPNEKVEIAILDAGVPVFPWRSVGHSINGFVIESFIDELAHLAGQDPFAYRMALLDESAEGKRKKGVLAAAAKGINWHEKPAPGRFRGIAQHAAFGSFAAHAVELSIEDAAGKPALRVHRVVGAIDCGRAINPDLVRAQIQSGTIYGLSAALLHRVDFDGGRVRQSNFHDYPIMRMSEAPAIDVVIVDSSERPSGCGELGVPPIAPALGNAFFAATGVRLRRLPMKDDIELVLNGKKPNVVEV